MQQTNLQKDPKQNKNAKQTKPKLQNKFKNPALLPELNHTAQ